MFTCDTPLVDSRQSECHLRSLGSGGLDHLGLVQADPPPLDAGDGGGHGHVPLGVPAMM